MAYAKNRNAKIKKIHHIGIAVKDFDASVKNWEKTFGLIPDKTEDYPEWGVKLAFYKIGELWFILVEGKKPVGILDPSTKTGAYLKNLGEGFFHMAFLIDDIHTMVKEMNENKVSLFDTSVKSEGYEGSLYAFVDPAETNNALVHLYDAKW